MKNSKLPGPGVLLVFAVSGLFCIPILEEGFPVK